MRRELFYMKSLNWDIKLDINPSLEGASAARVSAFTDCYIWLFTCALCRYTRNIILHIMCGVGEDSCIKSAADYFKKWMEENTP